MTPETSPARRTTRGFTLIELLIVIAVVGLLSTLAMIGLTNARDRAKSAAAAADLKQFSTAIGALVADTGKWPFGCPADGAAGLEDYVNNAQSGLFVAPTVATLASGCAWTAQDIAKWRGPYISKTTDPWGNVYFFDSDYQEYKNCASKTAGQIGPAVVSFGPNGVGVNAYDCDDINYSLR